jgi:hypothetical protein
MEPISHQITNQSTKITVEYTKVEITDSDRETMSTTTAGNHDDEKHSTR